MTHTSVVTFFTLQIGNQLPPTLQTLTKSQDGQALGICLSIQINLTFSLSLSEWNIWQPLPPPPIHNPLEEVQSFQPLSLTISHNLSWAKHISKLASKASRRLGIFCRTKSFLGTPELLSTYKVFIHSASWRTDLSSGLAFLPHVLLSLTSWKPSPS